MLLAPSAHDPLRMKLAFFRRALRSFFLFGFHAFDRIVGDRLTDARLVRREAEEPHNLRYSIDRVAAHVFEFNDEQVNRWKAARESHDSTCADQDENGLLPCQK